MGHASSASRSSSNKRRPVFFLSCLRDRRFTASSPDGHEHVAVPGAAHPQVVVAVGALEVGFPGQRGGGGRRQRGRLLLVFLAAGAGFVLSSSFSLSLSLSLFPLLLVLCHRLHVYDVVDRLSLRRFAGDVRPPSVSFRFRGAPFDPLLDRVLQAFLFVLGLLGEGLCLAFGVLELALQIAAATTALREDIFQIFRGWEIDAQGREVQLPPEQRVRLL